MLSYKIAIIHYLNKLECLYLKRLFGLLLQNALAYLPEATVTKKKLCNLGPVQ